MLHRVLVAAAVAFAACGVAPLAQADPTQCPSSGCPHGPAAGAPGPGNSSGPGALPAPPPANVNSPSYKDGYKSEHDFYATPQNHAYLASEMRSGYTATSACQLEVKGGTAPPNLNDWLAGCVDALHDLGFKP